MLYRMLHVGCFVFVLAAGLGMAGYSNAASILYASPHGSEIRHRVQTSFEQRLKRAPGSTRIEAQGRIFEEREQCCQQNLACCRHSQEALLSRSLRSTVANPRMCCLVKPTGSCCLDGNY
jgi:hypothetical protein